MVYECARPSCGGWADRLRGIMSVYAWSILTNRQFVINMTFPCQLSHMLVPNKIDWRPLHLQSSLANLTIKSVRLIDDKKFQKNLPKLNVSEYEKNADVLVFRTNVDFLKPLFSK